MIRNSILIALALWPVFAVLVALGLGAFLAGKGFQEQVSDPSDTDNRE